MKVLFSASVTGHLESFHIPYLQYFKEKGFTVHTASGGENTIEYVDQHFNIPFERSPFSHRNLGCYKKLKKIIQENHYDIIHCHTPVVSVLTRLAARKSRKHGTTVIYTAHGFHFYNGAPYLQATIFKQIEKKLCRYTDHLITINKEDYDAVKRYHFKPGAYYKVPGVGVDASRFSVQTIEKKQEKRAEYGIDPKAFVLIFAAEYSHRKNQKMLIEAVRIIKEQMTNLLLLLPGEGPLRSEYTQLIDHYGLKEHVWLMGFRRDMDALLATADVAVSSSVQEGLPINIVEAMAVSLPAVVTRIRGHVDLVRDEENGFLVEVNDAQALADRVLLLYNNNTVLERMKKQARSMAEPYFLLNAKAEMKKIYEAIIKEKTQGKDAIF